MESVVIHNSSHIKNVDGAKADDFPSMPIVTRQVLWPGAHINRSSYQNKKGILHRFADENALSATTHRSLLLMVNVNGRLKRMAPKI